MIHRRAAAGIVAAALAGSAVLWACGPFLPRLLLTDEPGILESPSAWLRDALEPLLPKERPPYPVVVDEKGPVRQTAAVDRRDLEAALASLPAARRQAVVGPYVQVRDAIAAWREQVEAWRQEAAWADPKPPMPPVPPLAVPAGLPGEFDDYLRGAVAYHQGKTDAARAAWEKLLARPAGERRLRSTWAAFMLGKAASERDPDAAARWFGRTRELAAQGFPDPLGLAQSSLGWQARAELGRKRLDEALKLYLQQQKAGDPTALPSIRRACARGLADPAMLKRAAASDAARPIVTAWVLSVWTRQDYDGPLDPEPARKWLAAVEASGVKKAAEADRLAWAAYRAGDFAAAGRWLKLAPADAPMARWVRAKLLLRDGKVAEAEALLAQAAAALPAGVARDANHDLWTAYESQVAPPFRPRASGELGAARLAHGEYADALDALLRGGFWTDAAYVAERVLTTAELRSYVDRSWPADLAARYRPQGPQDEGTEGWDLQYAGLAPPPSERVAHDLRYLLGRRLLREGKVEDASAYLPEPWRAAAAVLGRDLAAGRDGARSAADRAASLFHAACLTRHRGLELLGTELEPDWRLWEGEYELDPVAEGRADPKTHRHFGPSKDESTRAASSRVEPFKRFHYRYRGADLAREAAALLPDGDDKARTLASAGTWLKNRDPKAAKPFYDALLACCGDTALGRKARSLKALPTTDACPADTKPAAEEQ